MIRAGFDVGGTFTDFVLEDADGRWHTGKRLTTYPDPSEACLEGLKELLSRTGVTLADVDRMVHGTTLGSNIVIERRARGVGLITTSGFRDVLQIGREKRYQVYDLQVTKPAPLIDRSMIWEVPERVLADGSVMIELDDEAARATLREVARKGVTSLAVCLLHSYLNPEHERRLAELAREVAPQVVVSLSSEVSPQFREYERASTTVVNAYVITAVREYLRTMNGELARGGYRGRLFIMQSGGGVATADAMWNLPVRMIESGPAAGALIAARFGMASGHADVVAFDMGGTTAKLSMIVGGEPASVGQFELHRVKLAPGSGIPMNVRSLDLVEIGAGGGSIARVSQGTIHVGPESAGSSPGPACYGRGGTEPTVTDANLVLGYFNPARFAGGTMTLDVGAARQAIARIAAPLGLTSEEAAWGIHRLVTLNMELATRVVSIERGNDPRTLALVATGGSGPAHACRMALALGMKSVLVPAAAGVASAVGLLSADVKFDTSRSFVSRLDAMSPDHLTRMFADMEAEAARVVSESSGGGSMRVVREVDLRYVGQGFELTVPLDPGPFSGDVIGAARRAFDEVYARRYGFSSLDKPVEATTWKVTAYGDSPALRLPEIAAAPHGTPAPAVRTRAAYFPETSGFVETPVYDRDSLLANHVIAGPAIIEERESTTVIPPGMTAVIDHHGTARVEVTR